MHKYGTGEGNTTVVMDLNLGQREFMTLRLCKCACLYVQAYIYMYVSMHIFMYVYAYVRAYIA